MASGLDIEPELEVYKECVAAQATVRSDFSNAWKIMWDSIFDGG